MMKILQITLFIFSTTFLYNCSSKNESQTESPDSEAVEEVEIVEEMSETPAVCIWDKILVRENPSQKAKAITTLSVGESLFYLGKDSTVEKRAYTYIKLNDGQIGWALKDFIVNDAKPAVVLLDMNLYSRPDLLTKMDKRFKMMDIISSIEDQGEWMKIKGRRFGAKWMDEGWVKSSNISFDAVDIAVAKFGLQALAVTNEEEKIQALNDIIDNGDLSTSKFIDELENVVSGLTAPEEVVEEEIIEELSNEINETSDEEIPTDSIQ